MKSCVIFNFFLQIFIFFTGIKSSKEVIENSENNEEFSLSKANLSRTNTLVFKDPYKYTMWVIDLLEGRCKYQIKLFLPTNKSTKPSKYFQVVSGFNSVWMLLKNIALLQITDKHLFARDMCLEINGSKVEGCICRCCENRTEFDVRFSKENRYILSLFDSIHYNILRMQDIDNEHVELMIRSIRHFLICILKLILYYKKVHSFFVKEFCPKNCKKNNLKKNNHCENTMKIIYIRYLANQDRNIRNAFKSFFLSFLAHEARIDTPGSERNIENIRTMGYSSFNERFNHYSTMCTGSLGPPESFFICLETKLKLAGILDRFYEEHIKNKPLRNFAEFFGSDIINVFLKEKPYDSTKNVLKKYFSDVFIELEDIRKCMKDVFKTKDSVKKTKKFKKSIKKIGKKQKVGHLKTALEWLFRAMMLFNNDKTTISLTDVNIYFNILCIQIIEAIERTEKIRYEIYNLKNENTISTNPHEPIELFVGLILELRYIAENAKNNLFNLYNIWIKPDKKFIFSISLSEPLII